MILFVPLSSLKLFTSGDLAGMSEEELVARLKADHPALVEGAKIAIEGDLVRIEFPEVPAIQASEALRLLEKGIQRSQKGEFLKAVGIFERVLELDPGNAAAYRNLGMVFMELGKTEEARRCLVEAALLNPKDAWPYVVLGNALARDRDKLVAAQALLEKAHEIEPEDPWAMNSLGGICTERGDLAAATTWFEKSLAIKSDFANSHYGLANVLATQGKFESARERLQTLFEKAEYQDARSRSVFSAARSLWLDTISQLANARRECSLAEVRAYLASISERSGFPVKEEWADFPENFAAQTQMAWKKGRDHHLIRLRRGYPEPAWHHILAHEATHIALESAARAVGRNRWFVTTEESRAKALKLMEPDIRKISRQGYPVERLAELVTQLLNGASALVFNAAIDMVIESRLRSEIPSLADAQLLSLDLLAREAAGVTSHRDIRKVTPERILSVNDTLNAVGALFLRDLSRGALDYVEAYRPFHCMKKAESLYDAWKSKVGKGLEPGQEYDLTDEFATQLGVRGWYVWRPDMPSLESADEMSRGEAKSRKIESPAALMFLVAAMDRLHALSDKDVAQVAMETALKGNTGLDLDSAEKQYSIGIFGNERFSGLEMVCLMRVALERINPGADTGIDFGDAWNAAQMMHAAKIEKKSS
jgi:tetratricopeptide (TPR) repeat protein